MIPEYHLAELQIALDQRNPKNSLPPALPRDAKILDVGCGAGQSLLAAYPDHISYGIDIDQNALRMGRQFTDRVRFHAARAEALPFRDSTFDFVFARVSLPYTNIPRSLREIRRVLKPGGSIWLTLHSFGIPWRQARVSNYKGKIFFGYLLTNSILFHVTQKQFPFLGRFESFQTERGIRLSLAKNRFEEITVSYPPDQMLVTARATAL